MGKSPTYAQDSAEFLKADEERERQQTLLARKTVFDTLTLACEVATKTLGSDDERLAWDAAKHFLKLGGLEVEKCELSGKNGSPLLVEISKTHADKIRKAAAL